MGELNILITGGCGFIGQYLVKRLVSEAYNVTVLDDLSLGKKERLSELEDKIEFIKGDIRDFEIMQKVAKNKDIVFHLAAQSSVDLSIQEPVKDLEINAYGTLNVLQACIKSNVKRCIFFSSAAVYGEPKEFPITEKTQPNPISPYGVSKLTAEKYCKVFSQTSDLETVIFRTFNVYGRDSQGVIAEFAKRIKANKALVIYGDGTQTRDFLHVNNVIEACMLALNSKIKNNNHSLYNLAYGKEVSINELVSIFKEVTGKELQIKHEKTRSGDIKRSWTSIEKIKTELGYEPKYSLKEGVKELLE